MALRLVSRPPGRSYGTLGTTHHSLHDYAVLRAIHNITIIAPADNFETRCAIQTIVDYPHPVYVRFGKARQCDLHPPGTLFTIGKAITLKSGSDVCFIGTGETVYPAYAASGILEAEGVSCEVISMHTIKPLDTLAILEAARKVRVMITVEEHSVNGGLGEACAAVLMHNRVSLPFKIVGIPDEDTVTGSQTEIFAHYGISPVGLAETARQLLRIS